MTNNNVNNGSSIFSLSIFKQILFYKDTFQPDSWGAKINTLWKIEQNTAGMPTETTLNSYTMNIIAVAEKVHHWQVRGEKDVWGFWL